MATLPRQAVVVVHGIGEQRPLQTLLRFVRATSKHSHYGIVKEHHAVYGAPYDLGDRTDQRRLKVTWNHHCLDNGELVVKNSQANTDFYEYYWASEFSGTSWRQLASWLWVLVRRRRGTVSTTRLLGPVAKARRAILTAWLLIFTAFLLWASLGKNVGAWTATGLAWICAVALLVAVVASSGLGLITFTRTVLTVGMTGIAFFTSRWLAGGKTLEEAFDNLSGSVVVTLSTLILSGFFLRVLGDAARYLNNTPDNVESAETVRADAIKVLDALHNAKDRNGRPRYERIVVVGHSLGSVIAYDAVRHLWAKYNKCIPFERDDGSLATALVRSVEHEAAKLVEAGQRSVGLCNAREALWRAKYALYLYLRDRATPQQRDARRWIISDLVTLGSPLTYADLLLAGSADELKTLMLERMLAYDPPQFQRSAGRKNRIVYEMPRTSTTAPYDTLHHAAVFAATRWTNLYFTHDLIGGPVAPHFGPGVHDVPLRRGVDNHGGQRRQPTEQDALPGRDEWIGKFLLSYPHSSYWKTSLRAWSKLNNAASKKARELLGTIVEREPCVIIRTPTYPSQENLERIRGLMKTAREECREASSPPTLQMRMLAGLLFDQPYGVWLGGDPRVEVTSSLPLEIKEILGDGTSVYVGRSPDSRPTDDGAVQVADELPSS